MTFLACDAIKVTMKILSIVLVAIVLLWQALRIIIILALIKTTPKIRDNTELKEILPGEIPAPVKEAFAKISGVLQTHNLVKVGDFRAEFSTGYWSLYRDDNERMLVKILSSPVKKTFYIELHITTYFTDGTIVFSANTNPTSLSANISPNETLRYFPDCMPEDLLRLHKEYIALQTPHLEKKELPQDLLKFLGKEIRESLDIKIKKGQLKRDKKDERYLKHSFFDLFSSTSLLKVLKANEGRGGKHPGLIPHLPYTRGFAQWANPGSLQTRLYRASAPGYEKKESKWRWEFIVPVLIIIFLFVLNYLPNIIDRSDYLKYRQEHYRKLYTFGQVQVSPLAVSLEKIGKWLETYYQPAARSLQPGLSREQVQPLLKDLPLTIPGELYNLYSWHNGQQRIGPGAEFIPAYSFLSLQDALKTYRDMRELSINIQGDETWPSYFFPILSFQDSFYVVLCGGEKPGTVLDLLLEDPEPGTAYPTIAVFMQEIAENFDAGAYYIDDEGEFNTDDDKIQKVFKKYHPALPLRYSRLNFNNTKTAVNPDGSKVVTSTTGYGHKRIKYFDSRGMVVKEELYGKAGLQEVISFHYNLEGKIQEREYLHLDIGGKKSEHRVKWEYNPNGTITITKVYPQTDHKETIEAVCDNAGKWRVIKVF